MGVLEWKMCNFFKLEALNVNSKYANIKDTITSNCSNMQYKVFCNNNGYVYVFLGDWECISFQASNSAINFCTITDESDLLVIHDEGSATEKLLKIYSVSKLLKRRPTVPVSCATLGRHCKVTTLKSYYLENQLYLAVGLEKGHILLYKSTISRDITGSAKTLQVCGKPIKGIEFLQKDRGDLNMFVCSDAGVFCYSLISASGNHTEHKIILDDEMEAVSCCALKPRREPNDEQYFVVGKQDAVYCYTIEGKGPCFALKCSKQIVRWFGKHLIVVKSKISVNNTKRSQLVIINIENSMMVLNEELFEIECIFPTPDYENCIIFTKDGAIYTLRDQEIRYKLQMLYSKNLYDIALKLIEGQATYSDLVANVFVNYGDHLLQRGDIEESVKMYVKTIGQVPPFRVISKLLNFRYNEHLIQYLRKLVKSGVAPQEYSDLLNNCDKRLELPGSINKIFRNGECPFDLDSIEPMGQEKDITKYFLEKSEKGLELFSENGHWIVSNYPFDVGDIVNRILSNGLTSAHQPIDLFIRVMLPLLLSNKECVLNVLSSLDFDYRKNPNINLIWAEILLQKWKKFSGEEINALADAIKENDFNMSMNDIFIICRTHQYLPGIKMMYESFGLNALNFNSFLKCCFTLPLDTSAIDLDTNKYSLMWMQTLSKDNLQSAQSSAFVKYILSKTLHSNSHYTLTILQKISANTNFNLSHLNKALPKDIFLKQFAFDNFRDIAATDNKLKQIKRLLTDYQQKPMEFRNSKCDICKQPLKHPSIYYLCQHSYHKECLSSYSEITGCLACAAISQKDFERRNSEVIPFNKAEDASSTLKNISHKLAVGVFAQGPIYRSNKSSLSTVVTHIPLANSISSGHDMYRSKTVEQPAKSTNPFEESTNPFDDEEDDSNQYDSNLNPFEQGKRLN
ncbi:vacuolar protein sorting-associated protein 11 homolog [Stomoxys calcitrans]|uniref:vacuolar protein sorting-associated protein 11 homolog n=1 Tax=Stomoxys calcitrans TaxID=35570 RepID=UPI0027E2D71B|nr:vacuolar protein sorting-associated protein 11 homolog [Stomoxys calcitrans]